MVGTVGTINRQGVIYRVRVVKVDSKRGELLVQSISGLYFYGWVAADELVEE